MEILHKDDFEWRFTKLGEHTNAPIRDQNYLDNVTRCETRVRHVLTVRYQSTLQYKDPEQSGMTATAGAVIRTHGVEALLQIFKRCCPERTQEVIGRDPLTPEDLLEIQPPNAAQMTQYANYLTISVPAQGSFSDGSIGTADVGVYLGSATSMYGLKGRWLNYEAYKGRAMDGIYAAKMDGTHLEFALQQSHTMNLRGWIYFPQKDFSRQQCILWEGLGMDLFNTLHLHDKTYGRYRTPEVLSEAEAAVPKDLFVPLWTGLNDAHALKQGVGAANEYCHMRSQGCSTEDASAVAQPGLFDEENNKAIYLCVPCTQNFYEFRTTWNCLEDGRRCSQPGHIHKVLATAEREDTFDDWMVAVVRKWQKQAEIDAFRGSLFEQQGWKCPCGRALHSSDPETKHPNTFRSTLLRFSPMPTLGCDACYTDWSLHHPQDATVVQLDEWKEKRAAWRVKVNSKAKTPEGPCLCSTPAKPVNTEMKIKGYRALERVCKPCNQNGKKVVKHWEFDMKNDHDNAKATQFLIGLRGPLEYQIEKYPESPNCTCAKAGERIPALLEWAVEDNFPLNEPRQVCQSCRLRWTALRSKTLERARRLFKKD